MLNGKHDETWNGCERVRRETPWNWNDGAAEGGRVRDRVRLWWRARSSGPDHPGTREGGELEQSLACAEDPRYAWVRTSYRTRDARVPVYPLPRAPEYED